ncbi:MAG: Crp/Fnr family transcriptional regulator [Paenibacillaceae bacterium]|uniref:Crp/Fnr family transcriptional regulator n=1 Tax=Paenibacillus cymbidii TaxID=1639034 RepID=UPI0010812624|nr:Crp/Fnr family transcriptional regulator [Paenibacillus cymbidii]MBO9606206.1 Crp/Fnr family transcriptional regulator [Paenibacillaceae bacterium]
MDNPMNELYAQLKNKVAIPPEEWRAFAAMTERRKVPKLHHFVEAGERTETVGFCIGGLFRLYYATPDGAEFNKSFCLPGEFVASYGALLQDVPSYFSIQALTDSELVVFRYREYRTLYDRHPCWERFGRLIAEQLFVSKETRERELLLLSAEARYRLFLERYGPLASAIPQYHIASYLGITPVALSRIRRRLT